VSSLSSVSSVNSVNSVSRRVNQGFKFPGLISSFSNYSSQHPQAPPALYSNSNPAIAAATSSPLFSSSSLCSPHSARGQSGKSRDEKKSREKWFKIPSQRLSSSFADTALLSGHCRADESLGASVDARCRWLGRRRAVVRIHPFCSWSLSDGFCRVLTCHSRIIFWSFFAGILPQRSALIECRNIQDAIGPSSWRGFALRGDDEGGGRRGLGGGRGRGVRRRRRTMKQVGNWS
jgi:hypothetical protein